MHKVIFRQKLISLCFTMIVAMAHSPDAFGKDIRIPVDQHDRQKLPLTLVRAAIARSAEYSVKFPYGDIATLPLSTRIESVRNRESDIFFAITKPEYEHEFQAVYIPIYRGLMGMRLAIVKRENKDLFKNVNSISDLKQYTSGQGKLWADSEILEANNLPIVKELKYTNLFRMLEADRFDYFPRGAHEPWAEVKRNRELDLVVDAHVMLWYDAPFYIFVHKSHTDFAKYLTQQFDDMIYEGEFYRHFSNDTDVKLALSKANLAKRKIIRLKNPSLTPETPKHRMELWHDPSYDLENI